MRFLLLLLLVITISCTSARKREGERHVFLDVGAAKGVSIDAFKTTSLYKREGPWEIYAVEPGPDFYPLIPRARDVKIIPEAAWIYDGEIQFFKTTKYGETRNSVFFQKGYNSEKVTWKCFDFGKWLKKNFSKDDVVILSLDIAGGEPAVLEHMLEDGSIDLIDRMYVEFSFEMLARPFTPEEDKELRRAHALIEKIRARGILFDNDSAEDAISERFTWVDQL